MIVRERARDRVRFVYPLATLPRWRRRMQVCVFVSSASSGSVFWRLCREQDTPAAHVLRAFMRKYVATHDIAVAGRPVQKVRERVRQGRQAKALCDDAEPKS